MKHRRLFKWNNPPLERPYRPPLPDEKLLLKRTAKSLAKRFGIKSKWVEDILGKTIIRSQSLLEVKIPKRFGFQYTDQDSIIRDTDLKTFFSPSLIEALSILGSTKTISIFGVDESQYDELDITAHLRTTLSERNLTADEEKKHENIRLNIFLFKTFFRDFPPPINFPKNTDESNDDKLEVEDINFNFFDGLVELLFEFKDHLISQKDSFIFGNGKSTIAFKKYPWFDCFFETGVPINLIGYNQGEVSPIRRGSFSDRLANTNKFSQELVSNLDLKKENWLNPDLDNGFRSSLISKDTENRDFSNAIKNEEVQSQEIKIREKLFKLRINAIDIIVSHLLDDPGKDPVDALTEYICKSFGTLELHSIFGTDATYFKLPSEFRYRHGNEAIFHKLLVAATYIPAVNDSKKIHSLYSSALPIFQIANEVEEISEGFLLQFSYYELIYLIKPNQLANISLKLRHSIEKFSSIEKRAYDALKRLIFNNEVEGQEKIYSTHKKKSIKNSDHTINKIEIENSQHGQFKNKFTEYHSVIKKIGVIEFKPDQVAVIRALYDAHLNSEDGRLEKTLLIGKIFSSEEAKKIKNKIGKKQIQKDGSLSITAYDWRLEKTRIKEHHPAWKFGLVKAKTIKSKKYYFLDLKFESNFRK